ncbi:MAG TPA: hypothetical protein PK034_09030, partial [Rugosibacter sp.]|nr:hypothetical protein [Rugosibacter sp.]
MSLSANILMSPLSEALCASNAFQEWVGADDAKDAAAYVFLLTADRELKNKASGYNCAVISHGTGFAISRATLDSEFQTLPEYEVEFVSVIDVNDEDSVVFNALLSSIAGILADLLAQSTLLINDVYFATDKTPQRAA